MPISGVEFKDI